MSKQSTEWNRIKYCIFDMPMLQLPFEERITEIQKVVSELNSPQIVAVEMIRCTGTACHNSNASVTKFDQVWNI